MDADALRTEVALAVRHLIAGSILHNTAVAQRMGFALSDSQFLHLLELHGPLTPGRLAEHTGLSTGTVTGVIDRLERGGYVSRGRDATDRRKVVVTLRPESLAEMEPHYREHGRRLAAVLDGRDAPDLDVILSFLRELTAAPLVTPPPR